MSGPELCPKCKGQHFRNAPCIVRKPKREPSPSSDCKSDALTKEGLAAASSNLGAPTTPKRGPGRPKTITDMRAYKAMKAREYRARPKPTTKREKNE